MKKKDCLLGQPGYRKGVERDVSTRRNIGLPSVCVKGYPISPAKFVSEKD